MRDDTPTSATAPLEPGLTAGRTEPGLAAFGLGSVQALDTGLSGPFIGELRHGALVEPGTRPSYGLDLEAVLRAGHQRTRPGRGPAVPIAQYAPRVSVPSTPSDLPGRRPAQVRVSRISTRGNPPETESVSAAFVKPARSKTERVPT